MGNKKQRKSVRFAVGFLNLLFPVRDIARIVVTAPKPLIMTLRRAREVFHQQAKEQADLSWAEALAASGSTEAALARRYGRSQWLWRAVMCGSLLLSLVLLTLVIGSWTTLSAFEVLRAVSFLFVLISLTLLGFVKAMEATFRRWQLMSHRVSITEKGTFRDFTAENAWIRQTMGF